MHELAIRTRERGMVNDLHNLRSKDNTKLTTEQMEYESAYVEMRPMLEKVKNKPYRIVNNLGLVLTSYVGNGLSILIRCYLKVKDYL